jgi:hypothetical protein
MKKLSLIFILLLLPFFLTACIKKPEQPLPQDSPGVQQEFPGSEKPQSDGDGESSLTGSFLDILKMGKSVKCEGTLENDEGTMNLEVYASEEKSYTETQVESSEGEKNSMYAIFDGEWFYNWGDLIPTATKMKVSDVEELSDTFKDPETSIEDEEAPAGDMAEELDYKCSPWVPDMGKFIPPKDVDFVDMAQMMDELTETYNDFKDVDDAGMKQQICGACGIIPDATKKAECLSVNECK